MLVDLQGIIVKDIILRNHTVGDPLSLKYAYHYCFEFPEGTKKGQAEGSLGVVVHSAEDIEKVKEATLFINIDLVATFDVFDAEEQIEAEKESLRILFPQAVALIAQLTASSHMSPIYIPNLSASDIEEQYAKSAKKKSQRKIVHTETPDKN